MYSFTVEAMVRNYHIYHLIWDTAIDGEDLECVREAGSIHDPSAVAIIKDSVIVGHVPRIISAVCSSFIRRGGLILCKVTGSRRYSADLPQGGVEVPCVLTFQTSCSVDSERARKLIDQESTLSVTNIKAVEVKKTEDLTFVSPDALLLESCSVKEDENFQDGTTSVLKDSTNISVSLVSDDDDDCKSLAKKR